MMRTIETLQGYVTVRKFNGFTLPVPLQNSVLRDYCKNKNATYALPLCEMQFDGCFLQLNATVDAASNNHGITMCSLYMLPESEKLRHKFFNALIAKGSEAHFVFEGIVVSDLSSVENVEEFFQLRNVINNAQKTMDKTLLGEDASLANFCG